MGINVETLHHASLLVTDLERSKDFYGRMLGLREIDRPAFNFPGAWYEVGDGQIHLIVNPDMTSTADGINTSDAHIALRVDNFWGAVAHLEACGVELVKRPENRTPWPQMYCTDPDGNVIELNAADLS